MIRRSAVLFLAIAAQLGISAVSRAQVVGTYDNFDCFNDTGEETEGFEIDIEDISCPDNTEGSPTCDLTRIFPSNFGSTPWVIRYGLPKISTYDFTSATADPAHAYDQGHRGVLVTYAATWNGTNWVAPQASSPDGYAGNGTPYNKNPTITAGDSCWWYGLGAAYPTSGCDHFGVSFTPTAAPGKITYHWKVPDPNQAGQLINWGSEASIPPSPTLSNQGGGAVQAIAAAPDNEDVNNWGPAYFVEITTLYANQDAVLENLQQVIIKKIKTRKTHSYHVLQKPPAGQAGEIEDVEDDNVPANDVQVTKQYQYWTFGGLYSEGEAYCDTAYKTLTDAQNGTNPIQNGDSCSVPGSYWVNPNGAPIYVKTNKGHYLGAHINADNLQ